MPEVGALFRQKIKAHELRDIGTASSPPAIM
jgi:hypothetical protein